uniref:MMS1_N domain-containing protein n=1 Tax=Angiostrongylus cantonensis TaxID=6313 RepID=A0A0K0DA27_ANGCA
MVGGEDGVLTVLDPGGNEKEPVLTCQQVGRPIIDIIIGDFLSTSGPTKIEELFSHEMTEHAYNMCLVPSQTTQQILVQSVGCVLTLYQGNVAKKLENSYTTIVGRGLLLKLVTMTR